MNQLVDRVGFRYGRWTVLAFSGFRMNRNMVTRRSLWRCRCDCGNEAELSIKILQGGNSQSCGCLHRERVSQAASTHKRSKTKLYKVWTAMKMRCHNQNDPGYKNYGARGIFVCDRWRHSFEAFAADMGEHRSGMSLERVDNSRGYEPGNVKWATQGEQMRNTRRTVFLELNGQRLPMKDWATNTGLSCSTIRRRLHLGWSVERSLTSPANEKYAHRRKDAKSAAVSP